MNKLLKNKTAVFLGTSYMVFKCMILSKNVFKKIYFISNKKSLKKKIKYVQFINFSSLNFFSAYPEIINTNLYYKKMNDIGYLEGLILRKDYYYSSVIFEKSNYF